MRRAVFAVVLSLVRSALAAYGCTSSVECDDAYGTPVTGAQSVVEAACDADVSCVAIQYNSDLTYGFKCSSTATSSDVDTVVCVK